MKFKVKEGSFSVEPGFEALRAPAIYGCAVFANGVMVRDPVSSRTEVTFMVKNVFKQDENQEALIATMIGQANNSSVRGLRTMVSPESQVVTNPETVLSLGIEIAARIRYLGDDEDVILFDGPVASFIIDESDIGESEESDGYYDTLCDARDHRITAIVNHINKYIASYEALMDSHAAMAGIDMDDSDNDGQTGEQIDNQTKAIMQAIVGLLERILTPSKNAPPPEEFLLQGLVQWIYANVEDSRMATAMTTAIVTFIDDSTAFISVDDDAFQEGEDTSEETAEETVEELAPEAEPKKRGGRRPAVQSKRR